jgi:hypothetical protein
VRVPENEPTAVGENETEMAQEAAGARLALQLLVRLKGAATATVDTCSGPVPVFVNVTVLALLVMPSICDEKLTLAGLTDMRGAVPVPVSDTDCIVPRFQESSATVSEPVTVPVTDGVNVTFTEQFDPPARVPGQLLVSVNPPLTEMFPRFSVLPPKLAIITAPEPLVAVF